MRQNLTLLLMGFILVNVSLSCFAELLELEDAQLAAYRGQAAANIDPEESILLNQAQPNSAVPTSSLSAPANNSMPSAGITIDINLQLYIDEIRWVDSDGVGSNGTQGAIIMKGFSMGSLDSSVVSPASIRGINLDVDGNSGIVLDVQQIGGANEGIDIQISSIQIQ